MRTARRIAGSWLPLLLWLGWGTGCASRGASVAPAPPIETPTGPPEKPEGGDPSGEERIRAAEAEVDTAERLLEQQQPEAARRAFDRAVEILLSVEGGAREHPEVMPYYDRLLRRIHDLDLKSLAPSAEEPTEESAAERGGKSLWEEELDSALALSDVGAGHAVDAPPPSVGSGSFDIPIDYNERVAAIVSMFQDRRRDWFQDALRRSGQYIDFAQNVLREEGVPQDLFYLAMVESAFKSRAVSRAGARGIWQFMRGTGRLYGLKQDPWVDDRFDFELSTRAAARHLKDLYALFGDWYLVMAAYNAGARKVERAIERAGTRDFWKLAKTRYLRRETKSYVPLILATLVIAKDPARYGFDPQRDPPRRFDVVHIDAPVDLHTAAKCAETMVDEMKLLNPELQQWVTPPNREEYSLKVPSGSMEGFCSCLEAIPPQDRVQFVSHTVRRGDTLSQIARRYRTTVAALAQANHMSERALIRPGQALTVPVPAGVGPRTVKAARRAVDPVDGEETYIVQSGDTLGEIARARGVPLSQLLAWNGLHRASVIHPGQRLVLNGTVESAASQRLRYRVRRGDTLSSIARRFGVSVEKIRQWNDLPHDRILVGDSLEIQAPDL